jgi:hypothetical protein
VFASAGISPLPLGVKFSGMMSSKRGFWVTVLLKVADIILNWFGLI